MGYCPQQDALIDQMTGRETLRMYCRLRGIREHEIDAMITRLARDLTLDENHLEDKLVGEYSGGNKRKLSTAIALIGEPAMVLLDEPTTGMDPSARRQLWDALIRIRNRSRQCIILTSHSMEECEALCTRISIMMKGRIHCLGSPQCLKEKYAEFYHLQAVVKKKKEMEMKKGEEDADEEERPDEGTEEDTDGRIEEFRSKVGGILVKEIEEKGAEEEGAGGDGKVNIKIPKEGKRWAEVFRVVEKAAKEMGVEDYELSQSTLEQVFLTISETTER